MNIQLQYGTAVAVVPAATLTVLDRATKNDIKVLLMLCTDTTLLFQDDCTTCLAERLSCSQTEIDTSLSFWRGTGIIEVLEDDQKIESTENTHDTVTETQSQEIHFDEENSTVPQNNVTIIRSNTRKIGEIPNYTLEQIEEFKRTQKDFDENILMCQNAWREPFKNGTPINIIMSLIEDYGFEWDFIIALLAHQAAYFQKKDNLGKSIVAVYREATQLHKEKIYSHEDLQRRFVEMEKMENFEKQIRDWFGLGNSKFTPRQKKFLSTWLYEYHYDIDVVEMAYDIAVDAKGTPNMAYINGILKRWYENGFKTVSEIVENIEMQTHFIKEIKEGKVNPDNCWDIVKQDNKENDGCLKIVEKKKNISNDINIIRCLFGIGHRILTTNEIDAFTSWRIDYNFHYNIIYYAYELTLERINEYSLPYIDGILKKWDEHKLVTIEEIKAYEKGYKEDKKKKKEKNQTPTHESSFDTNDFFLDAVKRSFGDDFDPSILNT